MPVSTLSHTAPSGDGTGGTSGSDGGDGSNGNDTGNTETEGETAQ